MAVVVRMPAVATGGGETAIQQWLVAEGDEVAAGQPLAEIETEKAVVEYESESAGTLVAILLAEGEAGAVGVPIAVLAGPGESREQALAETAAARGDDASAGVAAEAPAVAPPVEAAAAVAAAPERLFASPIVRRLAKERGMDLASLTGTGPGGRIVRRDLDALPAPVQVEVTAPAVAGVVDIPHTPMRRAIARRLTESVTTVPHFALRADCDATRLLELRTSLLDQTGVKVSLNDLVVKAVAVALVEVPEANAIWMPEATRRFGTVDIGVAVSIEGGLVTPVLRGVEKLGVADLSAALRDLTERARAGRLRQDEIEGGSFAVSNLGMLGVREFTAIINPPHAGILAVGAAATRAVVREDGTLAVAPVMTVTLSADHRVLDGALAARWLAAFQHAVENPLTLLVQGARP